MKKIVVLGGGTAGWLVALYVRKTMPEHQVKLIQSSTIGIIGVGEATTPNFVHFLNNLNIDPLDVLASTGGGIKNGINFVNWNGDGKKYFHGFKDNLTDYTVNPVFGRDNLDYYLMNVIENKLPMEEYLYQIKMSYENKIDLDNTEWALHFDTNLISKYLQKIGAERGVEIVEGIYSHATQDDQGNIVAVHLEDGSKHECDFIFDCTGFSRKLIGGVYKEKWVSYKKHLPMKKGIPFWLDAEEFIEPHTSAIAMKYGWMWKIPLQHRSGSGYIFDSDYINEDQALAEAEEYFGTKLKVNRIIDFEAGRHERYWIKNCMAVGLSSSFIEPLESTSIFLSIGQLDTFKHFINEVGLNPRESSIKLFNDIVTNNMDDTMNFIYFHYMTKRNDSEFWKNFRENHPPPKRIAEMLEYIKEGNLRSYNIPNMRINVFFALYSYLQVGYGLGILGDLNMRGLNNVWPDPKTYKELGIDKLMVEKAVDHKQFLMSLRNESLSKQIS